MARLRPRWKTYANCSVYTYAEKSVFIAIVAITRDRTERFAAPGASLRDGLHGVNTFSEVVSEIDAISLTGVRTMSGTRIFELKGSEGTKRRT